MPRSATDTPPPSVREERTVSVGFKLVGATVLVVAALAALVFFGLSQRERERQLRAKDTAARLVVDLFAASASAPLIFDDHASLVELSKNVGRNADVLHAGVFAHTEGHKDVLVAVAEFHRGDAAAPVPAMIPSEPTVTFREQDLVVVAPVADPQGSPIGAAEVVFSLARENEEIRSTQHRVLITSLGVAAALSLMLSFFTRRTIVRPLGRLLGAVRALEQGEAREVGVQANDEVGRLARAFERMASVIRDREDRLNSRNRDMRLLLDNVGQGFFTVDREGKIAAERSAIVDRWFGAPQAGEHFASFLGRIDERAGEWAGLSFDALVEGMLPFDVCVAQLPHRLRKGDQVFSIQYRAIGEGEDWSRLLVVLSDITSEVERERASQAAHDMMAVFERVSDDPAGFAEFFREASAMLSRILARKGDRSSLKRDLHTLKGNAALFGLTALSSKCHELESTLEEGDELPASGVDEVRAAWSTVERLYSRLGGRPFGRIELDESDYTALLDALKRRTDHTRLHGLVGQWRNEPALRRLHRIADQARATAKRLGKGDIHVEVDAGNARLPAMRWAPFWSAFAHVVRNALDHGIEPPALRAAAGKAERGTLRLTLRADADTVTLLFSDDGGGIDWDAVAARAKAQGMPAANEADLVQAIFAEGMTTRTEATELSGRGIGLAAVKEATTALGGRVTVQSKRGQGTTFRFTFPVSSLEELPDARPALDSLVMEPQSVAAPVSH